MSLIISHLKVVHIVLFGNTQSKSRQSKLFDITIKCIGTQSPWSAGGLSTGKLCLSPNVIILKFCYKPQTTLLQTRFFGKIESRFVKTRQFLFSLEMYSSMPTIEAEEPGRQRGRQTVSPSSSGFGITCHFYNSTISIYLKASDVRILI